MTAEQTSLFPRSDVERLCEYFRVNRFTQVDFNSIANDLVMKRTDVLKAWNKLNEQNRLLCIGESKITVLESMLLGQKLPSGLSPLNKHAREHYYKRVSELTGYPLHMILYKYADAYHVKPSDWEPQNFREEVTK